MLLIPLLSLILCILCNELPLAETVLANSGISHKVASSPLASGFIRPVKNKHLTAVNATATTTTTTTTTIINTTTFTTSAVIRNDLLCNNDSEFVCVCQQNAGNLLKHYILCNELIELDELPVIEMNIRRVNLSARLHTNETYESYFKRRVAAIVSNYCEQQADECMATTLRLKKENVVLLSIKSNNLQSTTIGFVVTKSQRRSTLSTMTILDSTKVKYVLAAQLAALSRILGGVRIEQVEMAIMEKYRDSNGGEIIQRDNFGLLLILSIVATFLTITYTIAAVRVCRDCYAKRQTKKNVSKLNNAFETPNYGTCTQPTQSEMSRSYENHNTIKTRTSEGNYPNNSNPGEIAIMDAYQMKRMFQCDPSQLPAEEIPSLSQTSNDFLVIYASKSLKEPKSQICDLQPQPKYTVHQSKKVEERKNSPLSHKIDKTSQENNIVEVPQKYANMLMKNEQTAEEFPHYNSDSTTYFCQSGHEFFEQQTKELPVSIRNQLMDEKSQQSTCNQSKTISELMDSNLKGPTIDGQLEATWNQPAIGNESIWLPNKNPRDKPYSLINSMSESSFSTANRYDEKTINLKLYQSNRETEHYAKNGTADLENVSLKDQLNHLQELEHSDCFAKYDKSIHFIQKSQTTNQLDEWSSETDNEEGDVYHKLSEAEEETET